ncbi:MAG: beta-N-acetylhexosaminidase [Flavobacteriales bacterium]|nr:beta-N-acetylhexosaminidase [Flavobacteriales bacterium]
MKKALILMFCWINLCVSANHCIIPEPVSYNEFKGKLISNGFQFQDNSNLKKIEYAKTLFNEYLTSIKISDEGETKIKLNLNNSIKNKEGYILEVNSMGILIEAIDFGGFHNALQTLKQLLPVSSENNLFEIPHCKIIDEPRFEWRGLMLDVSRHFFTVEEVKDYINKMSEFKFNKFHWHLTDDEGWRIEIKSLPKLTEIGAWRGERNGRFGENRPAPTESEPKTYGGFYTQEEVKEIIAFADKRNITIVPEIDVPGHSMALLAAYPELSTKKEITQVSVGHKFAEWFGDGSFKMHTENMLNPTDEKVYEILEKIYSEVGKLFPGEYIDMGGDECYKGYWKESDEVKNFMMKNNMKDMHDLQAYFINRVQHIIESNGKKMIGWDEITEGQLNKDAAVMSWQGMKGGIKAAKLGHKVVMSPTTFAYLDYIQGDQSVENSIYASLSLEKSYKFEPVPDSVNPKYIMGGQANLWTEVIPTLSFAYYMTYPRALSISETLWSPKEKKNWDNFSHKILVHFNRFSKQETNISKAVLDPIVTVYKSGEKLMCRLENNIPGTEIYYSIDNTYPVEYGIKYTVPFEIPKGDLSLRTQTFLNNQGVGRALQIHREELLKRL